MSAASPCCRASPSPSNSCLLYTSLDPCLNAILLKLFGTDGAIYDVREHFQGNASHSVKLLKDVAAETERLVHEAYAEDEKLYQHVVATQPQWLSHLA